MSLPLSNKHSYSRNVSNLSILSVFYTGIAFVTLQEKYGLQCKSCNALATFGCILEQCFFYTGVVTRSSAKQNGCSEVVRQEVEQVHHLDSKH